MSRFSPATCVPTSVKLTRTAYAQLVGQKFFPPKVFGQWKEVEGTPEWRWKDVGMKIVRFKFAMVGGMTFDLCSGCGLRNTLSRKQRSAKQSKRLC
jgi:SGT1 protein